MAESKRPNTSAEIQQTMTENTELAAVVKAVLTSEIVGLGIDSEPFAVRAQLAEAFWNVVAKNHVNRFNFADASTPDAHKDGEREAGATYIVDHRGNPFVNIVANPEQRMVVRLDDIVIVDPTTGEVTDKTNWKRFIEENLGIERAPFGKDYQGFVKTWRARLDHQPLLDPALNGSYATWRNKGQFGRILGARPTNDSSLLELEPTLVQEKRRKRNEGHAGFFRLRPSDSGQDNSAFDRWQPSTGADTNTIGSIWKYRFPE